MYKEIEYYGAKIKVSQNGDIIWNGKRREIYYNHDGYSVCSIKTNKGWRSVRVARLVAIAYIPNPQNLPEVNHKDYNRKNSNVDNLEWISRKDNVQYSICNRPDCNGANNPNYKNKTLANKYANDKDYAKEKQSRKGLQNGRCRKIHILKDNICVNSFDYILDCCKYMQATYCPNCKLESIRNQIDKSIRKNTLYKGFKFKKE